MACNKILMGCLINEIGFNFERFQKWNAFYSCNFYSTTSTSTYSDVHTSEVGSNYLHFQKQKALFFVVNVGDYRIWKGLPLRRYINLCLILKILILTYKYV